MTDLLTGKTAIIYGGGGGIAGEVARAFAREGERVTKSMTNVTAGLAVR
jgi:NAD(P)-dependent dehydrogenase (short-subunit alcohol dehydrogenase family)